jgi:hypothetical protein
MTFSAPSSEEADHGADEGTEMIAMAMISEQISPSNSKMF